MNQLPDIIYYVKVYAIAKHWHTNGTYVRKSSAQDEVEQIIREGGYAVLYEMKGWWDEVEARNQMTKAQGREIAEAAAQREFKISIDQFAKRWKKGELHGRKGERVAMLLPLIGINP